MSFVLSWLKTCVTGVFLATVCASSSFAMVGVKPDDTQPLDLIVQYKSSQSAATARSVGATALVALDQIRPGKRVMKYSSEADLKRALAVFKADPNVAYVERGQRATAAYVPNDPLYPQEWDKKIIHLDPANNVETGGGNVLILIADTAYDCTSIPDLAPNCRQDLSQNYISDPAYMFHGFWTAGIAAAAINNGIAVAGNAGTAKIAFARFLDHTGNGSYSDAITAWNYALQLQSEGWRVIVNNSWTGTVASASLQEAAAALYQADVVNVAAAGNNKTDNCMLPFYPAVYPGVISVAATDERDALAYYSNYGSDCGDGQGAVFIAAPGSDILGLSNASPGTTTQSGTSAAAPQVSGAAALILTQNPGMTVDALKQLLASGSVVPWAPTLTNKRLDLPGLLGPARPHFVISASCPSPATINQGQTLTCNAGTTAIGGLTGNVALACSGVPSAQCQFSPASAPVGQSSSLSLVTSTSTPVGGYAMTVTGVLGSETETTAVPITVNPAGQRTLSYSNTTQVPFSHQCVGSKCTTVTPVTSTIAVPDKYNVEHLSGSADISFTGSNITATLTSPAGTVYSIPLSSFNGSEKNVPFATELFDGQGLAGNWILTIKVNAGNIFAGTLFDWNLSAVAVPAN